MAGAEQLDHYPASAIDVPQPELIQNYNRRAAIKWAIEHSLDPQTNGKQCTWYISQILWQGGFPKSKEWTDEGQYISGTEYFNGTVTANAAPNLIGYLQKHFKVDTLWLGMIKDRVNAPFAKEGDIIAYSWNGNQTIDHLAFVTTRSDTNPYYPHVAEWGQLNWDGTKMITNRIMNPSSNYISRGWDFSKRNNKKIGDMLPMATATLIHIP